MLAVMSPPNSDLCLFIPTTLSSHCVPTQQKCLPLTVEPMNRIRQSDSPAEIQRPSGRVINPIVACKCSRRLCSTSSSEYSCAGFCLCNTLMSHGSACSDRFGPRLTKFGHGPSSACQKTRETTRIRLSLQTSHATKLARVGVTLLTIRICMIHVNTGL